MSKGFERKKKSVKTFARLAETKGKLNGGPRPAVVLAYREREKAGAEYRKRLMKAKRLSAIKRAAEKL